ncbi:MAG: 4-hydroxythreonine-4-phosphate dehydrogenase PdxA, partial [Candidatus Bathyarchaeia archaeon]
MDRPVVAVTMGDPAGSGPEIVLKALTRHHLLSKAKFVLVGDMGVFKKAADIVGAEGLRFAETEEHFIAEDEPNLLNVVDLKNVDSSKHV